MSESKYSYAVCGHWPFPVDMLRHDQAEAATLDDQETIDRLSAEYAPDRDAIRLVSIVNLVSDCRPSVNRWESFNWIMRDEDPLERKSRRAARVKTEIVPLFNYTTIVGKMKDGTEAFRCTWAEFCRDNADMISENPHDFARFTVELRDAGRHGAYFGLGDPDEYVLEEHKPHAPPPDEEVAWAWDRLIADGWTKPNGPTSAISEIIRRSRS